MTVQFVFWYWWVLATVLLGIEIMTAGFFFVWMSAAAVLTGFLALIMPFLSLNAQLFIFAVLSMVSVILWKRYMNKHPIVTDHPHLNQRGAQYIGRTFTLIEAIENGQGRVKVDDSRWRVEGEDCPQGSTVKVVAVDGTVFKVIRVN
jgi:membrane protein implicated in regulation of membrane protease activity